LGVNATGRWAGGITRPGSACFSGHPPLGVNATDGNSPRR